jgi:hypothetical protein
MKSFHLAKRDLKRYVLAAEQWRPPQVKYLHVACPDEEPVLEVRCSNPFMPISGLNVIREVNLRRRWG